MREGLALDLEALESPGQSALNVPVDGFVASCFRRLATI